ncbi:MAG TPA: S1-like domain-containing RNA-binding protein [Polyangiaceae bacterium]|nr:S1-like domain-containing RNA-binding protein [Polyangiaceae bacterium]
MSTPRHPFEHLLGRFVELEIRRFGSAGAFLAEPDSGADAPTLLLLGPEIEQGAQPGNRLSVFVYLDSEGRPLATTKAPKLTLGEVAFLRVSALTSFGAFMDWGLPKDLLVPLREQTTELHVGDRHAIGLYVDEETGRLTGTMRVTEMLSNDAREYEQDQWLDGEAWRREPEIGVFVIVNRTHVGLVPAHEPHSLRRGDRARFRITNILPDGKMELSLRAHAHEQLADDAAHVLAMLKKSSASQVGDSSSPEQIRNLFGLSKKAFKRAIGRLLKEGSVELGADGYVKVKGPRAARTNG